MTLKKEVKLSKQMRDLAIKDSLPNNHHLFTRAAALETCAERAFVCGGSPPGAYKAFIKALNDARLLLKEYKKLSK